MTTSNQHQAPETISFADVQAALQHCLRVHPPQDLERVLCKDASLIADVFGDMHFYREAARPIELIRADRLEAIRRWLPQPLIAGGQA